MKVELKKLGIYERLSDETTAFAADLWIDGVKVGHAKNDGQGGMTIVHWARTVSRARRDEIEAALKERVPAEYHFEGGVEWVVDALVEAKRVEKETAKQDASFKRTCTKRNTSAARFEVPDATGKDRFWIEYAKGREDAAKAEMLKKYPALEAWTVIA